MDRPPSGIYICGSFSHFSKETKVLKEGSPNQGFYGAESSGDRQEHPCLVEEPLSQALQKQLRGPGPTELL